LDGRGVTTEIPGAYAACFNEPSHHLKSTRATLVITMVMTFCRSAPDKRRRTALCILPLPWRDGDLDRSVRSEVVAIRGMMLGVPMANASFHLAQKIEATLLGQVSEVANKICDGMLVACAAMSLEDCHRVGGPRDVVWLVDHGHTPTSRE